jgi:hypothetical protein
MDNIYILEKKNNAMDNFELEQKAEAWIKAIKKAEKKIKKEEDNDAIKKEIKIAIILASIILISKWWTWKMA